MDGWARGCVDANAILLTDQRNKITISSAFVLALGFFGKSTLYATWKYLTHREYLWPLQALFIKIRKPIIYAFYSRKGHVSK